MIFEEGIFVDMSLVFSKLSKAAWQRECQGCIKHLKAFLVTFPFCFVATEPLWDLFLYLKDHNACPNTLAEKLNSIFDLYSSKVCAFINTEGKTDTETHPQRRKKNKKSLLDLSEMASESKCLNKSLHKCFLMNATIWDVG